MKMLRASALFLSISYLTFLSWRTKPFCLRSRARINCIQRLHEKCLVKLLFVILPDDKVTLVLGIFLVILLDTLSLLMMIAVYQYQVCVAEDMHMVRIELFSNSFMF